MMMIDVRFAVDITPDGLYHVTNVVMGMRGQHHVHSKESYERWKAQGNISDDRIIIGEGTCDCGMNPGDVEEFNGRRWHNDRFEKEDEDEINCKICGEPLPEEEEEECHFECEVMLSANDPDGTGQDEEEETNE